MKEVFAKRLKSARVLAKMSQDQLVHKMDKLVSKNAISKYENGNMMPNSETLLSLSKALGVKTDYFYREYSVSIENIEFRKKSKLGKKQINAIKEQVIDIINRYLELEKFLNIRSDFIKPLNHIQIRTKWDVEKAADELLIAWDLGHKAIPNVINLLEDKEIKVIEIDAPTEFDGFSGWADSKYPIIVLNKHYGLERKRLTALHELAHLILDFDESIGRRELERMCFQFGGALLFPLNSFEKVFGANRNPPSISELAAFKETYGISIQAIMARAHTLELISEHTYIRFRKWVNEYKTEEGLGSYIGEEKSKRFNRLLYRAASEEIISLSKAANLANKKLAEFRRDFITL